MNATLEAKGMASSNPYSILKLKLQQETFLLDLNQHQLQAGAGSVKVVPQHN